MSMKRRNLSPTASENIADEAALWLARRDRGLTPAEQDEYIQWLTADPRHAEFLAQHAAAFERMMKLYEWQPGHSTDANPDLFAPRQARPWTHWGLSLAAAAAIAVGGAFWWSSSPVEAPAVTQRSFLRVNESQVLPDGSLVELKDDSRIAVGFSSAERRVRLTGEAHFKVAKNPAPFVVQADSVAVWAVGTAFNMRADAEVFDVLVVEGKVVVERTPHDGPWPADSAEETVVPDAALASDRGRLNEPDSPAPSRFLVSGLRSPVSGTLIVAGQRAVVPAAAAAELSVTDVTPEQIAAALDWKAPRLQFYETPLTVAVEEFNRWNRVRLVVGQRDLGAVPIGGTFRIDNVEGFVRLLEITLDLHAVRHGDEEIVLTRQR